MMIWLSCSTVSSVSRTEVQQGITQRGGVAAGSHHGAVGPNDRGGSTASPQPAVEFTAGFDRQDDGPAVVKFDALALRQR